MENFKRVPEFDEAELKVMVQNMYNAGGAENVLQCILTMRECEIIVLKKLNEILDGEDHYDC